MSKKAYSLFTAAIVGVICLAFFYPFPYVHQTLDYDVLLLFFILGILLTSMPLTVGKLNISLFLFVQVYVFIRYGLLVELLLSQLVMIISQLFTQVTFHLRHVLLHMVYFLSSLAAAFLFHLYQTSFSVPAVYELHLIPILIFAFVKYGLLLLGGYMILKDEPDRPAFERRLLRRLTYPFLFSVSISILALVVDQQQFGMLGAFIVSIPAVIISYIFKLLNDLEQTNRQLAMIHGISSTITSDLHVDKHFPSLIDAIKQVHPYDLCAICTLTEDKETLEFLTVDHSGHHSHAVPDQRLAIDGLFAYVLYSGKTVVINKEDDHFQRAMLPNWLLPYSSILVMPFVRKDQVHGLLLLTRLRENGFQKKELTILDILVRHIATALQNTFVYQQTEKRALTDELTGLHNYRGFNIKLEQMIQRAQRTGQTLALLVIDLDHFKRVNDRFGHLAGNKVLQHIALLLRRHVRKQDIVARYGGEEFMLILPDTSESEALDIAERVRLAIPTHPLKVRDDLSSGADIYIQNTISVGLSVYPDHADDALSLIRNADRAMYVGAKQAGRNRVAVYEA